MNGNYRNQDDEALSVRMARLGLKETFSEQKERTESQPYWARMPQPTCGLILDVFETYMAVLKDGEVAVVDALPEMDRFWRGRWLSFYLNKEKQLFSMHHFKPMAREQAPFPVEVRGDCVMVTVHATRRDLREYPMLKAYDFLPDGMGKVEVERNTGTLWSQELGCLTDPTKQFKQTRAETMYETVVKITFSIEKLSEKGKWQAEKEVQKILALSSDEIQMRCFKSPWFLESRLTWPLIHTDHFRNPEREWLKKVPDTAVFSGLFHQQDDDGQIKVWSNFTGELKAKLNPQDTFQVGDCVLFRVANYQTGPEAWSFSNTNPQSPIRIKTLAASLSAQVLLEVLLPIAIPPFGHEIFHPFCGYMRIFPHNLEQGLAGTTFTTEHLLGKVVKFWAEYEPLAKSKDPWKQQFWVFHSFHQDLFDGKM